MYETAFCRLKAALKISRKEWGFFEFPEIDALSEQEEISQLKAQINNVLVARKKCMNEPTGLAKCKSIMEHAFIAFAPFAKNVLGVAGKSDAVCQSLSPVDIGNRWFR